MTCNIGTFILRSFVACETPPLLAEAVLALGIYGEKLVCHIGFFFLSPTILYDGALFSRV